MQPCRARIHPSFQSQATHILTHLRWSIQLVIDGSKQSMIVVAAEQSRCNLVTNMRVWPERTFTLESCLINKDTGGENNTTQKTDHPVFFLFPKATIIGLHGFQLPKLLLLKACIQATNPTSFPRTGVRNSIEC